MDESINEDLEYSNESYQLSMSSIKYSQGAFDTFGKEKQEVM